MELFYKLFLIDRENQKAVQLCPFVKSGIMHKNFQPHLRPDGLGIDYSKLADFDTHAKIMELFAWQRPGCETNLKRAMQSKDASEIEFYLGEARRIGLDREKPELIDKAKALLRALS